MREMKGDDYAQGVHQERGRSHCRDDIRNRFHRLQRARCAASQEVAKRSPPRGGGQRPAREDDRCARALRHPGSDGADGPQVRARRRSSSLQDRTRIMDEQGIDVEALSINPFWYEAPARSRSRRSSRIQNEKLAELCAAQPDRFVAFASVALQYPDLAVQQLEHAVKKLGLRGAAVGSRVGALEFADPKFHPFWAKAKSSACSSSCIRGHAGAQRAAQRQRRARERHRQSARYDDRAVAPHLPRHARPLSRAEDLRGARRRLPAFVCGPLRSRLPHVPGALRQAIVLKKKPTEYLKQLYFDSLIFTPEALRHLARQVGSSQIVHGHRLSVSVGRQGGRSHPRHSADSATPRKRRCSAAPPQTAGHRAPEPPTQAAPSTIRRSRSAPSPSAFSASW